jgi:hypothetical protein
MRWLRPARQVQRFLPTPGPVDEVFEHCPYKRDAQAKRKARARLRVTQMNVCGQTQVSSRSRFTTQAAIAVMRAKPKHKALNAQGGRETGQSAGISPMPGSA